MKDESQFDRRILQSRSVLFGNLDAAELDELLKFAQIKTIEAKEIAFHKGSDGNEMFAIINGRVKISALSSDGKEVLFDILETGDVFGEISLFDGKARSASVTAIERCRLLVLDRRNFLPFLENNPRISIKMLTALCERIRATNELLEDHRFLDFPSRLAKKIGLLARNHGQQTDSGIRIDLKLTQEELGNLVGASRESINKQIRIWEGNGLLTIQQGHLVIHQPQYFERSLCGGALSPEQP